MKNCRFSSKGVLSSLPKIFQVRAESSLISEIQNAIGALGTFLRTKIGSFDVWSRQSDMFAQGSAPIDRFTTTELALAAALNEARTQKDVKAIFSDYAALVNGIPATMFDPAQPGKSKSEAVKELFGVTHNERQNTNRSDSGIQSESLEPETRTSETQPVQQPKISGGAETEKRESADALEGKSLSEIDTRTSGNVEKTDGRAIGSDNPGTARGQQGNLRGGLSGQESVEKPSAPGEQSTTTPKKTENAFDYGSIEKPNVPNLGRAFAAHFSDGNSFSTIVAARKFAGELLGGKVETGTDTAKRIDEAVEVGWKD